MNYATKLFMLGLLLAVIYVSPDLASSQGIFSVATDKRTYIPGETATIKGTVPVVIPGRSVVIQVFNPANTIYALDQITPASDGTFSTSIKLGGKLAKLGFYTVKATYIQNSIDTNFELVGEIKSSIQSIRVESELKDKVFDVLASLTNGRIAKIDVDPAFKSVIVSMQMSPVENGTMQITLPRDLIDAREGPDWAGADRSFKVHIGGVDSTFKETNSTATTRTLEIGIPAGAQTVEIIGTITVPEFPVSLIILTMSIAGLVIAIRFGIKARN
jgi:hypothetical protein